MFDTIIIGAGPSGISASLYLKRANKNVLIVYNVNSELNSAIKIDNYYGFEDGINGKNLYLKGILQAKNLGISIVQEEVLDIKIDEKMNYLVTTAQNEYYASSLIIATGTKRLKPNIKNLKEFEGLGVSSCAICDAFFYRNKKVAVLGSGNYAISEANVLKNVTNDITILTNGDDKSYNNYKTNTKKIVTFEGNKKLEYITFEDNTKESFDGVFLAYGTANGIDFAKKLGIVQKNDCIIVNDNMQTNIPGVYACGDVVQGLHQVCKAVYDGCKAGLSCIEYINNKN